LGGALAEIVGWFELRTVKPEDFPDYIRYWYYWFLNEVEIVDHQL